MIPLQQHLVLVLKTVYVLITQDNPVLSRAWENCETEAIFFFNWRIIALQCCVGFCHIALWIGQKYTCVPSWTPPPTPLDCHRAPGWAPCVTLQLPQSYLLYKWLCIFQCYSLNAFCPLLTPRCPQVCPLCLHLHCSLQIGLSVPLFSTPYIRINIRYLFFSFWLTSL